MYLMISIDLQTPAKINLYLRVLGRRPDGYHDIETLFQAIDLFDDVSITKTVSGARIHVPNHPELETADNLAMRALVWWERRIGRRLSVSISICKRIPIAAGLGGGSSDAAAVLAGLRALYDLEASDAELAAGAAAIGADVPFFLRGGAAVGQGIGDRLTPVDLPADYGVILVNPGFPVSTAEVYRRYSKGLTGRFAEGRLWRLLVDYADIGDLLYNDLQPVCEALHPEAANARKSLVAAGVERILMSGSGPTVFGIVKDPETLEEARRRAAAYAEEAWTLATARPIPFGVRMC
ncbi:MAG: 4-(cytidine 5'-diphospho)-2-C-methyl-D-erythritol kinase [Desulfomonilaceae bacterium]